MRHLLLCGLEDIENSHNVNGKKLWFLGWRDIIKPQLNMANEEYHTESKYSTLGVQLCH